jgi:hypothetical protein
MLDGIGDIIVGVEGIGGDHEHPRWIIEEASRLCEGKGVLGFAVEEAEGPWPVRSVR